MNDSTMPMNHANLLFKSGDDGPPFVFGPPLPELLKKASVIATTSVGSPEPEERFATVTIECWGDGYLENAYAIHDYLRALCDQ